MSEGYSPHTGDFKLQLHEEQLDISKEKVRIAEVNMHTEILTEDKTITVPVTRKELVVEKKTANGDVDTIRIPVSEERIEVVKRPVILEDIQVLKNQFQDTEHIEETLKKEQLKVETSGTAMITDNNRVT